MDTITLPDLSKKKKKLDPSIIRVNDEVKIIIPEEFDRVGYPLTKKKIIEEMTPEQLQTLNNVLSSTFGIGLETGLFTVSNNEPVYDKILDRLKEKFGQNWMKYGE